MVEIFERSKIARALDITDTQIGSHYAPSSFPYSSTLQPIFFLNLLSFLFLPSSSVSTANLWRPSKQHPPTYLWASHRPPSSDYFSWGYDNHSSSLSGQPTVVSSLAKILKIPHHRTPYKPPHYTRVGALIVATIYLQLIQNRYMFRSFTVLQCSHQHCVQPAASDVEVVGYL